MADKNPAYSRFEGGAGGCPRSSPRSCEKIESFPLTRPSATLSPSGGEGGNWHVFFPLALIGGEGPGVRGRVRSSQHLIFSHVPLIGRIFAGVIGILIVCAASTVYAQRTEVPQPLSDFVSRLESNLTEALKVAELLEPGRRELCALMRYYGPAAKAWQLEPSLAQEMGDQELFEYVVTRARSALAGGCELMSRHDCKTIDEKGIAKSKIREKYWSETSSGQCHISADGTFLTDSKGQPAALKNRSDLQDYWKLQKKFKSKKYESLLSSQYWETGLFRSNLNYLKKEFGPAFEEEPEMARATRLPPGGKVYAAPIMNLTYYIQYLEGQPPKVIFLSPLAW